MLTMQRNGETSEWSGYCVTPQGVVGVIKVVSDKYPAQDRVHLVIARSGRAHTRTYWRSYSTRYILTLAQRFASETQEKPRA